MPSSPRRKDELRSVTIRDTSVTIGNRHSIPFGLNIRIVHAVIARARPHLAHAS